MRVMCDTNILVRAVISPYGAAAELVRIVAMDHSLVTSSYLLAELFEVLRRPKIRKLHNLRDGKIRRVVSRFYKLSAHVPLPLPVVVPRDPKDNPIVMTAIAGQADILCTLDRHLHEPDVLALCASQGVRVLGDAELLAELRAGLP